MKNKEKHKYLLDSVPWSCLSQHNQWKKSVLKTKTVKFDAKRCNIISETSIYNVHKDNRK